MPLGKGYGRYWRMVGDTVERLSSFETPDDSWTRGIGPIDKDVYLGRIKSLSDAHIGIPKTQSHRERMSEAKVGVAKSDSHKASMSESQIRIAQRAKEIMSQHPNLKYHKAITVVAKEKRLGRTLTTAEINNIIMDIDK